MLRRTSILVLDRTWKYRTSNLPNPQKPNLEPTEPLVCPQKPNLEPTEPQKTKPNPEPNQVRPNTNPRYYLKNH